MQQRRDWEDGQIDPLYTTLSQLFSLEAPPLIVDQGPVLEFEWAADPWGVVPEAFVDPVAPLAYADPDWLDPNAYPTISPYWEGGGGPEIEWMGGRGPWPPLGPLPPPDALGFYLPFHRYFRPSSTDQVWGIYLVASAIRRFGGWLHEKAKGAVSLPDCCRIAQGFVYCHEYFHHRSESLVTRLEVAAGGQRIYLDWVSRKYNEGSRARPPRVREEALAEAYALREAKRVIGSIRPRLSRTQTAAMLEGLRQYTRLTGPPYDAGLGLLDEAAFYEEQAVLCADYRQPAPYDPAKGLHHSWRGAPFMTRGLRTVASSFWYVWDLPGMPQTTSAKPWQRAKAKALIAYAKHKGFAEGRQKGSHRMMEAPGQRPVPIPIHSGGDLKTGTVFAIIKQLGGTWDDYEAFAHV